MLVLLPRNVYRGLKKYDGTCIVLWILMHCIIYFIESSHFPSLHQPPPPPPPKKKKKKKREEDKDERQTHRVTETRRAREREGATEGGRERERGGGEREGGRGNERGEIRGCTSGGHYVLCIYSHAR